MMSTVIYHIRMKDFELQAERTLDPFLRTRPVAIISSHHQNGTVMALSAEAQAEGLFRGMQVSLARKMSHSARLLPYNQSLYARLNRYVYSTVQAFTPMVEPSGYGKFYLDMTGMERLYGDHQQVGFQLSKMIQDRISLASTIGISVNKLVSRISTAVIPDQIYRVVRGEEMHFLSPLETPVIPAVHLPPVWKIIHFLLLKKVRELQALVLLPNEARLLFGSHALQLRREVQGQDFSVVTPPSLKNHILEQTVLAEDSNDEQVLNGVVKTLAEQVAFKLRRRSHIAKQVRLEVHYADGFQHSVRGRILANDDASVTETAWRLFIRANTRRNRIRTVLIDVFDFQLVPRQMELFPLPEIRDRALSRALDSVRRKYGFGGIGRAVSMDAKIDMTS